MSAALEPNTEAVQASVRMPRWNSNRKKKPPRPRPDHCLNCGQAATGNFCAHCGQETKDHTVALRPLLADLLAEVISWDSKLLRTVMALLFRPGFLTSEYNAGRRVPYLSPLKLYLTVSVLFFLVLPWKMGNGNFILPHGQHTARPVRISLGHSAAAIPATVAEYDARQKALPPASRDSAAERILSRQAIRASKNPADFVQALLSDIPKMMFFLLPLFAGALKLLYLRAHRLYVAHLIFLLHVHAFAFLALTLLLLAHPDWLIGSVCLALTVYIAIALRVVYKQSWPKTVLKFSLLGLSYMILLSLCIAGTALTALWLF